ncbi:MAG: hypothetical protein M0P61_00245 [Ignavibacteriaceae bacterium]|nr:hypothetical protein [Ignavibacteriaceae bacterium]
MCVMVYKGEEVIGTVGELKKEFPDVPLILCNGYENSEVRDEYCLCPIDLDKMFKGAGISFKYDYDYDYTILNKVEEIK